MLEAMACTPHMMKLATMIAKLQVCKHSSLCVRSYNKLRQSTCEGKVDSHFLVAVRIFLNYVFQLNLLQTA